MIITALFYSYPLTSTLATHVLRLDIKRMEGEKYKTFQY